LNVALILTVARLTAAISELWRDTIYVSAKKLNVFASCGDQLYSELRQFTSTVHLSEIKR